MASAQEPGGLEGIPDAHIFATDGAAMEQLLGEVGLDAAWRAATRVGPRSRAMVVEYADEEDDLVAELVVTALDLEATAELHSDTVRQLRRVALNLSRARETERDRAIELHQADAHFRGTHALMQSVALDLFAGGDPASEALLGLNFEALTTAQRNQILTSLTLDEMISRRGAASVAFEEALTDHEVAVRRREQLETAHEDLIDAERSQARALRELEQSAREILPAAATAFSLANVPRQGGLTPRVLDAYINAEETMTVVAPNCRVSWQMLAAIGAVESDHGAYDDRRIDMEGVPDEPIIGLQLNGVAIDSLGETVDKIIDSDGGLLDGDPFNDRAVGPMQFIPDTWLRWEADGDGDGEKDPQDIDDATLAAAAYLCNYGSMRTWTNWNTAVFGYNHAVAYVESVKGSLDRVRTIDLPEIEGLEDLQPPRPWGVWEPPPAPELPSDAEPVE